jgi:hypothetical protein
LLGGGVPVGGPLDVVGDAEAEFADDGGGVVVAVAVVVAGVG